MKKVGLLSLVMVLLAGCSPKEFVENTVYEMIEKNPQKFMEAVQNAAKKSRPPAVDPSKALEEEFKNPKVATVDSSRILGNQEAPILIVEYTDLQCPFCSRGHATLEQLKKKYGSEVKVLRKHLPLPMHPQAKDLAVYYELVARQDLKKADTWAGVVFANQQEAKDTSKYDAWAKQVGADVAKINKDKKNTEVMTGINQRISADMEEASKFGFQGTPGYLVNGVGVKGAYPLDYFDKIIQRHLAK